MINNTAMERIKNIYEAMLKSGKLYMLYPDATGNWEEDKEWWEEEYYEFFVTIENGGSKPVAFYPIRNTIIRKIDDINKEQ